MLAAVARGPVEKPTPAGWSIHTTFALLDQLYGFCTVDRPSSATLQGPFSASNASMDEQPGPPVSQTTSGSFLGSLRDSKCQ